MDLLKQCEIWHENDEHQRIADALEAVPEGERTPEMDSVLARAYNNLADPGEPGGVELLKRAIGLLKRHEAYFQGDHYWNFRMGYAYFYLDQEGAALRYFEQALEAKPGDEDTQEFIDYCERQLSFPHFDATFRERAESAWEAFAEGEAKLRRMMDEDKAHTRGDELIEACDEILRLAFSDVSFEMGFNGEKYELILTPEGNRVKLFELVYFQNQAPASVLDRWNILVGRQPVADIGLRSGDWALSGSDVQVWVEKLEDNSVGLTVYSEKLLPLLQEDEGHAQWMLYTLTDQVIGEIPAMRYIEYFDVVEERREEPSVLLSELPELLRGMGFDLAVTPETYLETSYIGYEMNPKEDPEADWRLDIMAGSTCCPAFINEYLNAESDYVDDLHADGAVAGFLCYPLDSFGGDDRSQKIFAFRDDLEAALKEEAGTKAVALTGGATGIYCGYVDFIAWDLPAVLRTAQKFFQDRSLSWANFHVFRRKALTVPLVSQQEAEDARGPRRDGSYGLGTEAAQYSHGH